MQEILTKVYIYITFALIWKETRDKMLTHRSQDHPRFAGFLHVDDLPSSSTGKMNLGIYKHVLISIYRERPLQLRLRTNILFVTNFVKTYTNLYPSLWMLWVLKPIFRFSFWLDFFQKSFRTYVRNPLHIIFVVLNTAENLWCITFCASLLKWASA